MSVSEYMTKTQTIAWKNKTVPDTWPVAIDYGFSGVKMFAPNKVACFPNCAVKVDSFDDVLYTSETDIILRDGDGCWVIGEKAHEIISSTNAMNYESEMYGRNRYFSPIFRALMKVGLGMCMCGNHIRRYQGEEIFVQTGLPPKYKDEDMELIKESLAGDYDFEMRLGKGTFQHYAFTIREENIKVIDQPMGSLYAAITDGDGNQNQADFGILRSNTLVFDPGFKTLDIYDIAAGMIKKENSNTFESLGMHEVFRRVVEEAQKKYHSGITIAGMQNTLRRGYFTSFDRKSLKNTKIDLDEILRHYTEEVCEEAIQKLLSIYNYMQGHDYMIITGGTGDAWFPIIQERFNEMGSLDIISANRYLPQLPNTYSNVRGYYYFLYGYLSHTRR